MRLHSGGPHEDARRPRPVLWGDDRRGRLVASKLLAVAARPGRLHSMTQSCPISRRLLLDLILCVSVLMVAYAARGWILASWLQGAYPFSSLIADVLALGGLILFFRAADGGVTGGLRRLLGKE